MHIAVTEIRSTLLETNNRVKRLQSQVAKGEQVIKGLIGYTNQLASSFRKRLTQCESNIQSVASHLNTFQTASTKEVNRLRYMKAICGLLASVVGFVFAPMLKTAFDSLIDLANPIEIFHHAYQETDIVNFLSDKGCEELLRPEVRFQLEKYAIPTSEFETLLRQGVIVTKPELADECQRRGMTLAAVNMDYTEGTKTILPFLLKYETKLADTMKELDLVSAALHETSQSPIKVEFDCPIATRSTDDSVDPEVWTINRPLAAVPSKPIDGDPSATLDAPEKTGGQDDSDGRTHTLSDGEVVMLVGHLEALPYHLAVILSHGDLSEFLDLSKVIDGDVDLNAVTEVRRIKEQTQNVTISAAEYAQLMGYNELAGFISSQMALSPLTELQASVTILDDLEVFPLFLAVRESEGDVDEFKQWLDVLEYENSDAGVTVRATISRKEIIGVNNWSPVEVACHLGYVDIVKHLLLKKRVKTSERSIAVMVRVKERANVLAA
ncbi:hypothetical protein P3T76_005141 [Phytophthora citrophthora]|uniref:Uncharacterized protein n=1 Tax=Phytophthora citrophthora TaxID=4793 RepID=A0AAD9LNL5_9STRA|nr:hypothetical protein P3T76_005141 [Phytophthora citrophthora]